MIVPTVQIFKAGRMMIANESDLERFRAEGWDVKKPEQPIKPEQPKAQNKRVKAEKSGE